MPACLPESIDDVVAIMISIDDRLGDADGLKWFNRLYFRVTEQVRDAVAVATFGDPRFMAELDWLRQSLLRCAGSSGTRRREHSIGVETASQRPDKSRVARIQFALAGMNAHINRDLPAGIVAVFEHLGGIRWQERFNAAISTA